MVSLVQYEKSFITSVPYQGFIIRFNEFLKFIETICNVIAAQTAM